jgi:hypothetical protein
MRLWIEAQSMPIIALVVFGLSYLGAAVIFVLVTIAARQSWGREFKHIPAAALMPLAVLLAVLLGFLASRVWANQERANGYIGQEASALHEVLLVTPAFPTEMRTRLHAAVEAHIKAIETEEWPAMATGEPIMGRSPAVLTEAAVMVLEFNPTRAGEQLAQQRALAAIEEATEARRNRIMMSSVLIEGVQWGVIILLMALIMATIAMTNLDNPRAGAIAMLIVASASAGSLILLLAYDQPLNGGGFSVKPALLREVLVN